MQSILVVDSDTQYLKKITEETHAQPEEAIVAPSIDKALDAMRDSRRTISGIFVNANIAGGGSINLIRNAHRLRPVVPIYVMYDGDKKPFSSEELTRVAVQDEIPRPIQFLEMKKLIAPLPLTGKAARVRETEQTATLTTSPEDHNYLAVSIDSFYVEAKSFFDVYVRLESGRYLKILEAGTSFSGDRLDNYAKKDVKKFYVSKAAIERCINHCDLINEILPDIEGVAYDLKICHILSRGEVVLSRLKRLTKIARRDLDDVLNYTVEVHQLLNHSGLTKTEQVKAIVNNVSAYEHSLGTVMIAALMSKALKLENQMSIEIVGLASFLHDIGLYGFPKEVHAEDETTMTAVHRDLYLSHPIRGAEILEKITGVHPTVIQAVRQHHERRDGKGFPLKKNAKDINKVSEIVGISDEFVRMLTNKKNLSLPQVLKIMADSVYNGFSLPIVEAFQSIVESLDEEMIESVRKPKSKRKSA